MLAGSTPKPVVMPLTNTYWYSITDKPMSIQSFTTPAMFMVKAELRPMSMKTDMLRAAGNAGSQ
jgi:hypothetical protein